MNINSIKLNQYKLDYSQELEKSLVLWEDDSSKNNKELSETLDSLASINEASVKRTAPCFNLGKFAKSGLRTSRQSESLLEKYPDTSRYIGNIPYSWIEDLNLASREEINDYRNRLFEIFSEFAENTTCKRYDFPCNYIKQMNKLCADFEAITGKKAEIKYLNQGTIGRAFKFTAGKESYVVKIFFTDPVKFEYYSLHGKGAEILGAAYAKEHTPKGDFADFYFGKFAKHDNFDGFMVTKFIDYDNAKNSYMRNFILKSTTSQPLKSYDIVNNTVLDTIIDYGELKKGDLKNKKQYKIQRLIIQAITSHDKNKFDEICKKYHGKDLDAVLNNLRSSFYCYINSNYDDVTELSDNEIKILTSDKHNKIFNMLSFAINNENNDDYNYVLDKYKDCEELDYVLKLYNKNMTYEDRIIFARRVRKTELKRLSKIFEEFGIINPK